LSTKYRTIENVRLNGCGKSKLDSYVNEFQPRIFSRSPAPGTRSCLKFEEILVDVNQQPEEAAEALIETIKGFRERYGYRRIFAYAPETSLPITSALTTQGFRKSGIMKDYYFIDGYYVNVAVYACP